MTLNDLTLFARVAVPLATSLLSYVFWHRIRSRHGYERREDGWLQISSVKRKASCPNVNDFETQRAEYQRGPPLALSIESQYSPVLLRPIISVGYLFFDSGGPPSFSGSGFRSFLEAETNFDHEAASLSSVGWGWY